MLSNFLKYKSNTNKKLFIIFFILITLCGCKEQAKKSIFLTSFTITNKESINSENYKKYGIKNLSKTYFIYYFNETPSKKSLEKEIKSILLIDFTDVPKNCYLNNTTSNLNIHNHTLYNCRIIFVNNKNVIDEYKNYLNEVNKSLTYMQDHFPDSNFFDITKKQDELGKTVKQSNNLRKSLVAETEIIFGKHFNTQHFAIKNLYIHKI